MNRGESRDQSGTAGCQLNVNMTPIGGPAFSSDQFSVNELVGQADGGVMFDLEPFAQLADEKTLFAREGFQREQGFVLLRSEMRFDGKIFLTEPEEFPEAVTESGQVLIIWFDGGRAHKMRDRIEAQEAT